MTVKAKVQKKMKSGSENIKTEKKRLDGVVYDRVLGVVCPRCRMRGGDIPGGSITNTLPWEDGLRVRYHFCRRCGTKFKSIETE